MRVPLARRKGRSGVASRGPSMRTAAGRTSRITMSTRRAQAGLWWRTGRQTTRAERSINRSLQLDLDHHALLAAKVLQRVRDPDVDPVQVAGLHRVVHGPAVRPAHAQVQLGGR